MTGLADVEGFNICIKVCVWLGFQPLNLSVLRKKTVSNQITEFIRQAKVLNMKIKELMVFKKMLKFTEKLETSS